MYRQVLKSAATRARIGQRFMTSRPRSMPTQSNSAPVYATIAGISAIALTYATVNQQFIDNEVDEEKIEQGKQQALKDAHAEKLAAEKLKSVGQAEVDTKVAPETATPETKSEVKDKEGEQSEEGHQSAAFNPETGEINWDCPCLGGMAHGPCGEEFKEAFGCFVYSESEPKGIDCIEKFQNMRSCFKQHPEHYKEELYEDEDTQEGIVEEASSNLEEKDKLTKATSAVAEELPKETPKKSEGAN